MCSQKVNSRAGLPRTPKPSKYPYYHIIVCSKCGLGGGTMVKVGDHYEHQDQEKCRILQLRRKLH